MNYIIYEINFREEIDQNDTIIYENFSSNLINSIEILSSNTVDNKRNLKINLNSEYIKEININKIINEVEKDLMEFLFKLFLNLNGFYPYYKLTQLHLNEIIFYDYMSIKEELTIISKIPENINLSENIKFDENITKYTKMIKILELADLDPVTVYLTLYDWFLEWVSVGNQKKQKYIVEYMKNLEKENNSIHFTKNSKTNNQEDNFTTLRNDIAHAYERTEDYKQFKDRSKLYIKPLIKIMSNFLKTNDNI